MSWILFFRNNFITRDRSSRPAVFCTKDVLIICSKLTGEHQCRSVASAKLQSNFIRIILRHGCALVNLLHIFITPSPKNSSEGMLLYMVVQMKQNYLKKNYIFKKKICMIFTKILFFSVKIFFFQIKLYIQNKYLYPLPKNLTLLKKKIHSVKISSLNKLIQ